MPKKAILLKSLTRGRIRASFNKYNLFNLYKKALPDFRSKTLYQQKWAAKQETRAYHGEYLTEKRWSTLFQSKLDSVAQLDASLRGDGASIERTPYPLQTYAALEKRLDVAVFRAMFASSVRQARQFILHGNVWVNGLKIKHPGYVLKPGDMFHVRVDKVLEALGAKKPSLSEAVKVDKVQVLLWNKYVKNAKENPRKVWEEKMAKYQNLPEGSPKKMSLLKYIEGYNKNLRKIEHDELTRLTPKQLLVDILKVQRDRPDETTALSAKDFQNVVDKDEKLHEEIFKCYSNLAKAGEIDWEKIHKMTDEELSTLADNLMSFPQEMKDRLSDNSKALIRSTMKKISDLSKEYAESIRAYYESKRANPDSNFIPYDPHWADSLRYHHKVDFDQLLENEKLGAEEIRLPWQHHLYGRQNPKKPYFTPWKPRPFLAPFAILPHHLEVSFKTCHAVYLRDPVARPGHSEVISPFDDSVHERAYMYYVRKGK